MSKCAMVHKSKVAPDRLGIVFDRMVESGVLHATFHDGTCWNKAEFISTFAHIDMHYWVLFYDGELAGIAWLNGLEGRAARGHFCMFKNVWGRNTDGGSKSVELGRFVTASWLRHKDRDGAYLLDVVVGITPKRNRMAVKWVQRCGAVRRGEIPYGVWMADSGRSEDAVLSTMTRESTDETWAM